MFTSLANELPTNIVKAAIIVIIFLINLPLIDNDNHLHYNDNDNH